MAGASSTRGSRIAALFCVGGALAISGCSDGPFDIVKVSGTVTYEDGSLIPSDDFRLKFVPQVESPDGVSFPRVATAKVGADGKFDAATTHKYGDGLIMGEHKVFLKIGKGPDGKPLAPPECLDAKTTPLRVDLSAGRRLEVLVPKP